MWGLLCLLQVSAQFWSDLDSPSYIPSFSAPSFASPYHAPDPFFEPSTSPFLPSDNFQRLQQPLSPSFSPFQTALPLSSPSSFSSFTYQAQAPIFSSFSIPAKTRPIISNNFFPLSYNSNFLINDDEDNLQFRDDTFVPLPFGGVGVPTYKPKTRQTNPFGISVVGGTSVSVSTPRTVPRTVHYDLRGISKSSNSDMEPFFPLQFVPPELVQQPNPGLPVSPRVIAEWEPVQGALIRYPLGLSVELVRVIASELRVYVLCLSSLVAQATIGFRNGGVNMMNVVFVTVPTDTYWVRDYGPWFIRAFEAGKPVVRIVDVRYKEILTRPNDDRVPALMAVQLNQSTHYDLRTVCQGGNFMTDSVGSAASTTRLMDDNPSSSLATIQDSFRNVLGVQNYFLVDDPGYPTNYIEHVDCWCKFIGPKKVLVKRVPTSDPLYYAFETAASLWAERTNLLGEKYDVIRIDGPMNSFYLNQVILNDRVFVPAHATPDDALAISQIQAAYGPRFRVFPVLAAAGLPWLMTDSLHCRLTSIPVLNVPVL